jgi:hypothetical protein
MGENNMSKVMERRPSNTSAFAFLDQPRLGSADDQKEIAAAATPLPANPDWRERIDDLLRLYQLGDDWDGAGSPAPVASLVAGAIKLALTLKENKYSPAARVSASVDGTIYFEWYAPSGYEEIEVTSPVDAEWRWVEKGASEAETIAIEIR